MNLTPFFLFRQLGFCGHQWSFAAVSSVDKSTAVANESQDKAVNEGNKPEVLLGMAGKWMRFTRLRKVQERRLMDELIACINEDAYGARIDFDAQVFLDGSDALSEGMVVTSIGHSK